MNVLGYEVTCEIKENRDPTVVITPAIVRQAKKIQQFFRENSESWIERFEYKEAGPQLLLQAFLQRIINGGGRIEREFQSGGCKQDNY